MDFVFYQTKSFDVDLSLIIGGAPSAPSLPSQIIVTHAKILKGFHYHSNIKVIYTEICNPLF